MLLKKKKFRYNVNSVISENGYLFKPCGQNTGNCIERKAVKEEWIVFVVQESRSN